jgi:transposase
MWRFRMDAQANSQGRLDESWALGDGCVAINNRLWFRDEDGARAVFVDNKPFHTYDLDDKVQHRFCACQLVESKLAKQREVARAFGFTERTLERWRRRLREGGIEALLSRKGGSKGRRKAGGAVGRKIVKLWKSGCTKVEIAARLGLSEGTVRSVLKERGLGPGSRPPQPELGFADRTHEGSSRESDAQQPTGAPEAVDPPNCEPVEATSIPYASPADQLGAMLGMIEEAPVEFAPAGNVPMAGALLGIALLVGTGLLEEGRNVYGKLRNAWYGLRATLLTLFAMALLRIRRSEQLKGVDPAALGQVLGLPRAPEVKTVRRKLGELANRNLAAELHRRLARRRAGQQEEALAYLYVDGHVRAYSGKRRIGKAYVTTRKTVQRAETDYWVNLSNGQPLLVVHAQAEDKLTKMMRSILREIRLVIGDRRAMIVFDRGGWSEKLFRMIIKEGFDFLTYRKAPLSDWRAGRFHKRRLKIDGHTVEYELADGDFIKKGWPRLRCIAVKRAEGRQTQILCNRYNIDPVELAYRMFGRWKQENWFKYMGEEFALDVLIDYSTQPDDPDRMMVNPAWRKLDKQVKAASKRRQEAEAAYGREILSNGSAQDRREQAAVVRQARQEYDTVVLQRRETPQRVRLGEVSYGDPIKLSYERKLLTDTIKICAYQVETELTEMLDGVFTRNDNEGRAVIREAFQTPGDILPSDGELHISLNQLSAPRYTEALIFLCEQLNQRNVYLPETSLRLRFHVKPGPQTRQN